MKFIHFIPLKYLADSKNSFIFDETFKATKMIHLGNHYEGKYLDGVQFKHEDIKPKAGYVKSYLITNRPDAPIFKGVLNILEDGRAVMNVNYISYSGVKNKYENYFTSTGFEIVHSNNSTKEEKKFWNLKNHN